jgi:hypothetical protein
MSAWYVLSALGIYQVCPGSPQFSIGSPLFQEAKIHLENGKTFIIKAKNRSLKDFYIQDAHLNDTLYTKCYLDYNTIMKGGTFECSMGDKPNTAWGSGDNDVPVTAINDNPLLPSPYSLQTHKTFNDSVSVELKATTPDVEIYYTTDGSQPDKTKYKYGSPLTFKQTTHLKAIAFLAPSIYSYVMEGHYYKIDMNRKIKLLSKYSSQYTGGGDNCLIDGLRGAKNFILGEWQGYDSIDFEAIVDLGSLQKVHHLGMGCLQNIAAWIFLPKEVEYLVSDDGINFKSLAVVANPIPDNDYQTIIHDFDYNTDIQTRYIKVRAKNYGILPAWHLGAGGPAWIFTDEIIIE